MLKRYKTLAISMTAGVLVFSGCTPRVYSPPSRIWAHESPASAGKNNSSIVGSGGIHLYHVSYPDIPDAVSGVLGYRRGITDDIDLRADVTLYGVTRERDEGAFDNPFAGALRLGGKINPSFAKRFLSFALGVGGGSSMAGQFVSADQSIIVGFENPFVVPFGAVSFFTSFPINSKSVFLDRDPDPDESGYGYEPVTLTYDKPDMTYGPELSAGVQIHTGSFNDDNMHMSFSFLYSFLQLIDKNDSDGQHSIGASLEFYY